MSTRSLLNVGTLCLPFILTGMATAAIYDGAALPTASSPAWLYDGGGESDFTSSGGELHLSQSVARVSQYYRQEPGLVPNPGDGVAGTSDFYIEARFKLDANATQANNFYDAVFIMLHNKTGNFYTDDTIYVEDAGAGVLNLRFRRQGVTAAGILGTDDGQFHVYRMEYDSNAANASGVSSRVLVDGVQVIAFGQSPTVNFGTSFGDRVMFGNDGGGGPVTGFHWDYIDYGPIPEPSITGAMSACLFLMRRSRKQSAR